MKPKHFLLMIILMLGVLLSTKAQSIAWQRADSLDKGINLSLPWPYDFNYHKNEDFLLMKQIGFKHVRQNIFFSWLADTAYPYTLNDTVFSYLDTVIKYSLNNKLKFIISYANNQDTTEISSSTYIQKSERIAMIWKQITQHYINYNPDSVFFEILNEPFVFNISSSEWTFTANRIIDTIRTIDQQKTILVYGNNPIINPDSINDNNIIYTYHFYYPLFFTHQGAPFTAPPMYTTGIPFPYDSFLMPPLNPLDSGTSNEILYNNYPNEGTSEFILSHINYAKVYSLQYNVPVHCGEFGAGNGNITPIKSFLFWTELVRKGLDSLGIPWTFFDWKGSFCGMFSCNECLNGISIDSVYTDTTNGNTILCALGLDSCNLFTLSNVVNIQRNIKIYPNPFNETTTLEIINLKNQNYELQLYDLFGREIRKYKIKNIKTEISRDDLPSGMYFYQVKDNKQFISSGKLIVR